MIANARMYSVNAGSGRGVAHAARVGRWRARTSTSRSIDYPAPQPLPALWARADLGCAFMCGYPCRERSRTRRVLAAPVPSPPAYRRRSRSTGPTSSSRAGRRRSRTLDDAFGKRIALHDRGFAIGLPGAARAASRSQRARRAAVRRHRRPAGHAAPRRRSRARGRRRRRPARQLRARSAAPARAASSPRRCASIATTPPTPIPPLVARAGMCRRRRRNALRDALLAVGGARRARELARSAAAARASRPIGRATTRAASRCAQRRRLGYRASR